MRSRIGTALGVAWAPAIAALAKLRSARMFHPTGHTFVGHVAPHEGPYATIAGRLGSHVLARVSPALWRNGSEYLEVLGIALRFHPEAAPTVLAGPRDQDLLFATARSPFTLPLSPLTTNGHDFLANRYWAVAPFALDGIAHRVELRLTPIDPPQLPGSRAERLCAAVASGRVAFALAARRTLRLRWHPLATIRITSPIDVDEDALRFDPFATGAGIRPVGLVHAIRRAAYAASQRARPH